VHSKPVAAAFIDAAALLRQPPKVEGEALGALQPARERAKRTQHLVELLRNDERPPTLAEQALLHLVQHGRGVEAVGRYVIGRASDREDCLFGDPLARNEGQPAPAVLEKTRRAPSRSDFNVLGGILTNAFIADHGFEGEGTDAVCIMKALHSATHNSYAFSALDPTKLFDELWANLQGERPQRGLAL